ncbi:MAG: type II-A CRISPR-associated protein Csn2 [Eggerthellaceae bacterium]|jgi:CRISPR-associated protein Csn2
MIIKFSGLDSLIEFRAGEPMTLDVRNERLFSRICMALLSGLGEDALEPYAVWDDSGKAIKPASALMVISDPLSLPWKHRLLSGKIYDCVEKLIREDDALREKIETINGDIEREISQCALQMNSEYSFGLEWAVDKYLKAFNFGVENMPDDSLFDKLIRFLSLAADVSFKESFVFINIRKFLTEKEANELVKQSIFLNLSVLFLENGSGFDTYSTDTKICIDQDFIENR